MQDKTDASEKLPEKFTVSGDWAPQAKRLRLKYSQLTGEDVRFDKGKEDELIRRLEIRLGKSREDVIRVLKRGQPEKFRAS